MALHEVVQYARDDVNQQLVTSFSGTDGVWTAEDVRFRRRMQELHDKLTRALTLLLLSQSQHYLLVYETAAYRFGYYATGWQMDAANVGMLHDPTIALELEAPYIDATLRQRLYDVQTDFETKARRAWVLSQTEGDTLTQAQKRTDELWGLGKTPNGRSLWFRLLAIADSEFWRAANLGASAMMGDNANILNGKQWHTQEDERVCFICRELDGKVVGLDEHFGVMANPPAHPICRCFVTPALLDGKPNTERYPVWATRRQVEPGMDGTGVMA